MSANRNPDGYGSTLAYEAEYDAGADQSLAVVVSEALATVEDTDPCALDPLYDVVDFEAVERLFREQDAAAPMSLSFSVDGWNVHVHSDGSIQVYGTGRPTDPSSATENVVGD